MQEAFRGTRPGRLFCVLGACIVAQAVRSTWGRTSGNMSGCGEPMQKVRPEGPHDAGPYERRRSTHGAIEIAVRWSAARREPGGFTWIGRPGTRWGRGRVQDLRSATSGCGV